MSTINYLNFIITHDNNAFILGPVDRHPSALFPFPLPHRRTGALGDPSADVTPPSVPHGAVLDSRKQPAHQGRISEPLLHLLRVNGNVQRHKERRRNQPVVAHGFSVQ
jgi:hypothetical protein